MYRSIRHGHQQIVEPILDVEEIRRLLELLIKQNQLIVEANCTEMKFLGSDSMFVHGDPGSDV